MPGFNLFFFCFSLEWFMAANPLNEVILVDLVCFDLQEDICRNIFISD